MQPWLPEQFEFLAGLPEPDRQRRLLLTIQAYIDDSGVKGTDPVFVLAGFIGNADKWAEFSNAWKYHLSEPPAIRYLKMNEAAKLDGEFRFWKAEERDKKLLGCVEIIKKFKPDKGIYFMNDLVAWEKIVHNPVKMLRDPHFLGFYAMITAIGNEVFDSGRKEQVEIIFDEHVIFGPRIALWYPAVKEMFECSRIEGMNDISSVLPPAPMFRDDRQFQPLQAADILAWLIRSSFKERLPGLESAWRPTITGFEWLAEELLPHIPPSDYSVIWGHERIEGMLKLSQGSNMLQNYWRNGAQNWASENRTNEAYNSRPRGRKKIPYAAKTC